MTGRKCRAYRTIPYKICGKRKNLYSAANDPDRKSSADDSQTGNDPQDPKPQMAPTGKREWHGVWFSGFFLILIFIRFYKLNDELDKHKEKIF